MMNFLSSYAATLDVNMKELSLQPPTSVAPTVTPLLYYNPGFFYYMRSFVQPRTHCQLTFNGVLRHGRTTKQPTFSLSNSEVRNKNSTVALHLSLLFPPMHHGILDLTSRQGFATSKGLPCLFDFHSQGTEIEPPKEKYNFHRTRINKFPVLKKNSTPRKH